ncbi:MAG: ribulose-phosphate 3-epimerase [Defluviitaleaceae bacterium]|nr:ribulose-phosphate 3-epimerase [Defluviitaleaceae bacterium]
MKNTILAPSILSADFATLGEQIKALEAGGAKYLHLDVMDGHFVDNISFGVPIVASLRPHFPNLVFDCHLMIADPKKYIKPFADAGADVISFHYEVMASDDDVLETIGMIRACGAKAALAINPSTPFDAIEDYLEILDMVLIMSVNPGFGGQGFIAESLDKAKKIRQMYPDLDIQMDGGINLNTVDSALESGVNIIVVGSAILSKDDVLAETQKYMKIFNS